MDQNGLIGNLSESWPPPICPMPLASEVILDIAQRAVWNPANVSERDIQTLALSVLRRADAVESAERDGAQDLAAREPAAG